VKGELHVHVGGLTARISKFDFSKGALSVAHNKILLAKSLVAPNFGHIPFGLTFELCLNLCKIYAKSSFKLKSYFSVLDQEVGREHCDVWIPSDDICYLPASGWSSIWSIW
jgi:hypothetical protein